MTILLDNPGENMAAVGPLSLDMFWVSLVVSGTLILSVLVLGEYNSEEYGLEPQERKK